MPPTRTRLIVGCMTGTSMDGLDLALVRIEGKGLALKATLERTASTPYRTLTRLMRPAAEQEEMSAERFARLRFMLSELHVLGLEALIGRDKVDLIAVHGQTIHHQPPMSWQLIDPMRIAHALNTPVVYDLRGADLACGGQGAPITPIADHLLLRDTDQTRVVINLGGFINYTWLPPSRRTGEAALASIRAGDLCACNQLLDFLARRLLKRRYDAGGRRALAGEVSDEALPMLVKLLDHQARMGRSLGTGDECHNWVRMFSRIGPADLARTACHGIAQVVAQRIGEADRAILAGGGVNNRALVHELTRSLGCVVRSDEHGIPSQYREAMAMAVLGALCQDRVPITLPQVTGCDQAPVAGAWVFP